MKKYFYLCLFLLGIGLYFGVLDERMFERGGFAIGGEIFFVFLPLWVWLLEENLRDFISEVTRK